MIPFYVIISQLQPHKATYTHVAIQCFILNTLATFLPSYTKQTQSFKQLVAIYIYMHAYKQVSLHFFYQSFRQPVISTVQMFLCILTIKYQFLMTTVMYLHDLHLLFPMAHNCDAPFHPTHICLHASLESLSPTPLLSLTSTHHSCYISEKARLMIVLPSNIYIQNMPMTMSSSQLNIIIPEQLMIFTNQFLPLLVMMTA